MRFDRILKNITGLSCPLFGIQWNAPTDEVKLAEGIITFLEDKRVLFNPIDMEDANHCVMSVGEIRTEVTRTIQTAGANAPLAKSLRRIRSACHAFQNEIGSSQFSQLDIPVQKSILERELFKLRDKVGLSLAEVSAAHGLDVKDALATIIPFNCSKYT
ncbi:TPA: hypothetical protein I7680_21645 [Vibrio vulnificus]|uniref:DUF6650 family protein n=1 Tax=Vibrio vulnificus TaxID=672 RepID=UPI001A2BE7F0|nr:DUF6650 family protein [Vibrio vulnificus]MCG6277961.1 hypothetical protein [Vibrio vulnificus]HAS8174070.1 hypothetical protein [Vibrio vulnificus]HAS8448200.1 hypothetical protein [Vibrio vulnificus]HAS8454909.1 hypothetical protein [Vibrio vulnificus]HDY7726996.1 hypothetical protein [Vibrio vulnificus]